MRPLRHSYTNKVHSDGRLVVKSYEGPDRSIRRQRELVALTRLRGLLPVPALHSDPADGVLRLGFVAGIHGQDLIDSGHAGEVLRACGDVLRRIHAIDVTRIFPDFPDAACRDPRRPPGLVVVHGDFGPNNLLFDPATYGVAAVLDWEWTHPGEPVEDLAWCEWIIRMHHPGQVTALDGFFDAYGHRPSWAERHEAMQDQCRRLLDLCRRWRSNGVPLWQHRLNVTTAWTEQPSP